MPARHAIFALTCAAFGLTALAASGAGAQGFTTNDTQLRFDGTSVSPAGATARAGFTGTPAPGGGIVPIYFYRLPTLAPNTTITSAVFSVNLASLTVAGSIIYNVDLYALPFRANATVSVLDYFVGPQDTSGTATRIQDNFVARSSPASATPLGRYDTNATASANLAAFLNAQYANGAVGGASGSFVLFRLSPDETAGNGFGGYDFNTQDNTAASGLRPTLTLTIGSTLANAPEPATGLLGACGIFVAGIAGSRRRRK